MSRKAGNYNFFSGGGRKIIWRCAGRGGLGRKLLFSKSELREKVPLKCEIFTEILPGQIPKIVPNLLKKIPNPDISGSETASFANITITGIS